MKPGGLLLMVACIFDQLQASGTPGGNPTNSFETVSFAESAPYSDKANIARRFGYTVELPAYSVTNEIYRLLVPQSYSTNDSWGLLVWISPSDQVTIPTGWQNQLKERRLLLVGAQRSGNNRHPLDRIRLALDGACNMCRRYQVDRKRLFVGGFSGGSRMASMIGIAYSDLFTGTLCVCGVNFYADIAASDGKYYPGTFVPDLGLLILGKRTGRFVLLTAEKDQNLENTHNVYLSGFKREGFRNVMYFETPGMGHQLPDENVLSKALGFLSGSNALPGSDSAGL